jgi:hypothetical protein
MSFFKDNAKNLNLPSLSKESFTRNENLPVRRVMRQKYFGSKNIIESQCFGYFPIRFIFSGNPPTYIHPTKGIHTSDTYVHRGLRSVPNQDEVNSAN